MTTVQSFINRLKKAEIQVELSRNYPWVYLDKVNGHQVYERYYGNHGFTVFFVNQKESITDIPVVFNKIRDMLTEEGRKKDKQAYREFMDNYYQ